MRILIDAPQRLSHQLHSPFCAGDDVTGEVVLERNDPQNALLDVTLEGWARTWKPKTITQDVSSTAIFCTAQYQFLKENERVRFEVDDFDPSHEQGLRRSRFRFKLPQELISAQSDLSSQFLALPPTIHHGLVRPNPADGRFSMQPTVTYTVSSSLMRPLTGALAGDLAIQELRCSQEILVQPAVRPAPPLQIEHYTDEYTMFCKSPLKPHFWSHSLGDLIVSTTEPLPLDMSASTPRATSTAHVRLTFYPSNATAHLSHPHDWKLQVSNRLKTKTFCSSKQYSKPPTQSSTRLDPKSSLVFTLSKQETRSCTSPSWRKHRLLPNGAAVSSDADPSTPWTSTIQVPINASRTLTPDFLTPLSARRYALVLEVSIANLHHKSLKLEVPIQVIRTRCIGDCASPAQSISGASDGHEYSEAEYLDDSEDVSAGAVPGLVVEPPPYEGSRLER